MIKPGQRFSYSSTPSVFDSHGFQAIGLIQGKYAAADPESEGSRNHIVTTDGCTFPCQVRRSVLKKGFDLTQTHTWSVYPNSYRNNRRKLFFNSCRIFKKEIPDGDPSNRLESCLSGELNLVPDTFFIKGELRRGRSPDVQGDGYITLLIRYLMRPRTDRWGQFIVRIETDEEFTSGGDREMWRIIAERQGRQLLLKEKQLIATVPKESSEKQDDGK